ncbi:hypothetical protein CTEN210_02536 [Chaetoceros tenuissimus]|uniref:Uncharacterized protein n=1 Tax=Chaetoceros tenuissimus TaxID=426638 RepID=A0AAD3CH82_9STRA|nr:hypothetical protein CTEN210_02536 [Chaetoceros tenuissimus]
MNPFMITSNQSYGLQLNQLKELLETTKEIDCGATENEDKEGDSSNLFLYSRESDRFGEGVQMSTYPLAKELRTKLKRRKPTASDLEGCNGQKNASNRHKSHSQVEDILKSYNHERKVENPLYTTTSNEIGGKRPSAATLSSENYSRSQSFSRSFNSMFRDCGLKM